jgi:putative ABC transport system permease protein
MNVWPVVLADLRRRTWSAVTVVLLVAVAVSLGVAVVTQDRALRKGSARAADDFDLMIGAPGSETQLLLTGVFLQVAAIPLVDGDVLKALQSDPRVAAFAPIGFGDFHRGMPVIGTTAAFAARFGRVKVAEGRMFETADEVVAGANAGVALGYEFQPSHGEHVEGGEDRVHEGDTYRVVGRMARTGTPWDHALLVPIESVWETHAMPTGHGDGAPATIGPPWDADKLAGVPAIVVKPRSVADAYALRGEYRRGGTMAVFPGEVLVSLYALLGNAREVLGLIAINTQVLVVAAVLLAVLLAVSQRQRQLAVLRALGASRAYVFLAIWVQTAGQIALGAGLGLVGGFAGALLLADVVRARTGLVLPVSLGVDELALIAALVGAGSLIAIIPAWIAGRTPVAAALRGSY